MAYIVAFPYTYIFIMPVLDGNCFLLFQNCYRSWHLKVHMLLIWIISMSWQKAFWPTQMNMCNGLLDTAMSWSCPRRYFS